MRKQIRLLLALLAAGCASVQPDAGDVAAWPAPQSAKVAPEPELPDLRQDATLSETLAVALARNPRIQSARERVLASAEVGAIESALPDPQVLLGWYATPVETRVGPQEWSLGIRQSIPFPTKLSDRSKLGDTLADRETIAYERTVRDVLVEVVHTVHELAYIDDAIAISGQIVPLLERYSASAADAKTPLPELFRAQTQRAQLENDRVLLIELRVVEEERLRALLDLPLAAPIGRIRPDPVPRIDAEFAELLAIARQHNQELREAGLSLEAAAIRTSLARKSRLPDLSVGYSHIFTGDLPSSIGNPSGNGKDAQIVYFGFTLPLWANKNSAKIRRARALERVAMQDRRAASLQLRPQLARAWFHVGNARRLVELYRDLLIPRAEKAVRTAEDLQTAGKGSVAGTIETVAVLHNFRLAAARARADHGQAVATLEAILGKPLEGGVQ
jgi:outer membrane protein TolC